MELISKEEAIEKLKALNKNQQTIDAIKSCKVYALRSEDSLDMQKLASDFFKMAIDEKIVAESTEGKKYDL